MSKFSEKGRRSGKQPKRAKPQAIPVAPPQRAPKGIAIHPDTLFEFLRAVPLFVGAFAVSGFVLKDVLHFAEFFLILLIPKVIFESLILAWIGRFRYLLYIIASLFLVFVIAATPTTSGITAAPIAAILLAMRPFGAIRPEGDFKRLLIRCLCILAEGSCFSMLGVLSQSGKLILGTMALGAVPASFLAGAMIVGSASFLENNGYLRSFSGKLPKIPFIVKKDEPEIQLRPGRISQVLSLFLAIVPGLIVMAASLQLLPAAFLFLIPVVLVGAKLAQQFLQRNKSDEQLKDNIIVLALCTSIIMIFVGMFSSSR